MTILYPEDIPAGTRLKCIECGIISKGDRWREAEAPCDDCGGHLAIECPECGDVIDLVYHSVEEMIVEEDQKTTSEPKRNV
jgi:hypothetical protein